MMVVQIERRHQSQRRRTGWNANELICGADVGASWTDIQEMFNQLTYKFNLNLKLKNTLLCILTNFSHRNLITKLFGSFFTISSIETACAMFIWPAEWVDSSEGRNVHR